MAKTYVVKLEIDGVSESITSINQLEGAVSELESQLKSADLGSAEFKKLSKELGNAKKELNVFQRDIDALDPAAKAEQFVKFGEGIAGGFAIATGAAALLGVESETLEKTMVQAQGAIAIAVGFRSLAESKLLETIAQSAIAERARAAATAISTFVTGAATTGLKLFRLALVSTGVGLIVVALGFLAANFDKVKLAVTVLAEYIVNALISSFNLLIYGVNIIIDALNLIPGVSIETISSLEGVSFATKEAADTTDGYTKALNKLTDAQKKSNEQSKQLVKSLERQLELRAAQGASENELLGIKRKILVAKKAEADADEIALNKQKKLLEIGIRTNQRAIKEGLAEGKTEDAILSGLGWGTRQELADALAKNKDYRLDASNDLKVFDAQLSTNRREAAAEEKKKDEDAADDADALADELELEEEAKLEQKLIEEAAHLRELKNELALLALDSEFERSQKELEQQMTFDLEEVANAENKEELIRQIKKKYSILNADLLEDKLKKEKEIEDEAKAYKEKELKDGIDNLQNILSVGGKNMQKVGKALAIADVVRTSVKSVSEQVSSLGVANAKSVAASPLTGGMPFVAFNTLKAGLSIGSTLASAAKSIQSIKGDSTSVPSTSGGGGGGGGGGGAPNLGTPEETANIDFSFLGDGDVSEVGQTAPVQAYVIGSDVTSSQEASQVIKDQSTL